MINPLGTLSSHPMDPAPSTDDANSDDPSDPNEVAASPLLIVGAPRSGTTWLQRLLLGHPACVGGRIATDSGEERRRARIDRSIRARLATLDLAASNRRLASRIDIDLGALGWTT